MFAFLESLWRGEAASVAACLGLGADNELYNIMPTHGGGVRGVREADHLIYLTDVAGVSGRRKSSFRHLLRGKLTT